jgi:hypothetical protein
VIDGAAEAHVLAAQMQPANDRQDRSTLWASIGFHAKSLISL